MSDTDQPADAAEPTGAAEPTETVESADAGKPADAAEPTNAAESSSAAPRPRPSTSAASRARRIGGGTAAAPARPSAPRSTPDPVDEPTVRLGKKAKAPEGGDKAASTPDVEDDRTQDPARRTVTVPAWVAWAPAVAFITVAAVFLVLLLVNRVGGDDASATTSTKERQTVLAATKNCIAATNTYKYTDIDTYEAAGIKCTTGQYTKQYSNAMNTLIKKNAPTQQFTQIAKVTSAGVESVSKSGKQWSILVYGQLNITNKTTPKGRVDPFGLVATMTQAKGKWVVERIALISSAS